MEVVPLINVAAEDDLLITAASDGLPTPHSSGKGDEHDFVGLEATSIHQRDDIVKMSKQMEQILELSESPEQKPTKAGKYNLRKSLAWDNAFFTSEGVLNAEELAIVNSTYRKAEAHTLPGIPEDIRKSTESTSTLDSDSWALETLEVDLFENLRASIQKSLRKCDSKTATKQGELNASHLRASKKVVSSQNEFQMKLPSALQRHGVIRRRPEDTSRETLISMKVDASVSRDSKASLKPPRIAPRVTALPTAPGRKTSASGRVPTKGNSVKGLSVNAANRDSVVALKRSGESGTVTPRSIPSLKSTSRSHQGNEVSSVGSSSDSSSKSPLENSRKRTARNIDHPTFGSTAKTLMRTSKSKPRSSNSNNTPTSLKSMLKPSSSVSPHSSVDSLVSEASSSKSLSMKSSNSTEDLDADSSSSPSITVTFDRSVRQSSDFHKFSTDQPCSRTGHSETLPQGQLSSGNHSKSSVDGGIGVNCFKASGLRMPTPKIGYFDAEKSLVRSSNKYPQSALQNDASKNTGISNLGANKLKPSKAPSVKPAAQTATTEHDSPYVQATRLSSIHVSKPVSPSSLRRLSKPAELCGTLSHELSCESIMGLSPMDNKDSLHKIFEVEAEVSDVTEALASKSKFNHMITTPVGNESASSGEGFSNISCKIMQLTQQMGGTETHRQLSCLSHMEEFCMQNDSHSAAQTIQKEHCFHVDNTDGLSTHAD